MKAAMSEICAGVRSNFGMPARPCGDLSDEFAVLVLENHFGTNEARSAFAAAGVLAVAEGALGAVDGFTALDDRGVGRRALRKSLRGAPVLRGAAAGFALDGGACAGWANALPSVKISVRDAVAMALGLCKADFAFWLWCMRICWLVKPCRSEYI